MLVLKWCRQCANTSIRPCWSLSPLGMPAVSSSSSSTGWSPRHQYWMGPVSLMFLPATLLYHHLAHHSYGPSYYSFPGCRRQHDAFSFVGHPMAGWCCRGNTVGRVPGPVCLEVPFDVWSGSLEQPRALPCSGRDTCTRPWVGRRERYCISHFITRSKEGIGRHQPTSVSLSFINS